MARQLVTVVFDLQTTDHEDPPLTFMTALRMAIRQHDLASIDWLDDRIQGMGFVKAEIITGTGTEGD